MKASTNYLGYRLEKHFYALDDFLWVIRKNGEYITHYATLKEVEDFIKENVA